MRKDQKGPGVDNKLKMVTGGTASYFLADHLGSTTALTDDTGAITEQNSYDSFGNSSNAGFSTRYQYTGREHDDYSGLQYSRARWYDPKIGRFISEDPIGFNGGDINLYGYVHNNAFNKIDPLGLTGENSYNVLGYDLTPSTGISTPGGFDSSACRTESCRRDIQKMQDIYNKTLNNLHQNGHRLGWYGQVGVGGGLGWLNNFVATFDAIERNGWSHPINDPGEEGLYGCESQSLTMIDALRKGDYENPWDFSQGTDSFIFDELKYHKWAKATSPNNPSLRFDPWAADWGTINNPNSAPIVPGVLSAPLIY